MKTPKIISIAMITFCAVASAQTFTDGGFVPNSFGDNTVFVQPNTTNFDTWYAGHALAWNVVGGEMVRDASVRTGGTGFGGIFSFAVGTTGDYTYSFDYTALDDDQTDTLTFYFDIIAYDGSGAMDNNERLGLRQSGSGFNNSPTTGASYTVTQALSLVSLGDPGGPTIGSNQTYSTTISLAAGTDYVGIRFGSAMENPAGGGDTLTIDNVTLTAIPEPSSYALIAGAMGLTLIMVRRRRS